MLSIDSIYVYVFNILWSWLDSEDENKWPEAMMVSVNTDSLL